jgi:hypothetical protein
MASVLSEGRAVDRRFRAVVLACDRFGLRSVGVRGGCNEPRNNPAQEQQRVTRKRLASSLSD